MGSLIKDDDHNKQVAVDPAILQLAQLDFNLVQALHRRELAEVMRWWKESRLGDYSFARDRVVECCFCASCIARRSRAWRSAGRCSRRSAPSSSTSTTSTKRVRHHGRAPGLHRRGDAIASWEHCDDDDSAVVMGMALPEYMKAMYSAIWTTSATAADRVLEKHEYDMLPLYKKAERRGRHHLADSSHEANGQGPALQPYPSCPLL
ncbi:unnamed protein product [Miscanthus lutarioriparius]|uniref:Uncharacterized protein n=1 Tax=Miscanthus lutarioriparius TaxID=422564 RepID=A0A811NMP0_9POAL|nr:unnamed protein product [Miscanthus lutarioriparius]